MQRYSAIPKLFPLTLVVFGACLALGGVVARGQSDAFDFDGHDAQGWTMTGAYDENGAGPVSSNFTFAWKDRVNFPSVPGQDAADQRGSIQCFTMSSHGVLHDGNWWVMKLHSPDLSASTGWQSANGYSVQVAECMARGAPLYANLWVKVHDLDEQRDRYYYSGVAQPLEHAVYNVEAKWNRLEFDWSRPGLMPDRYVVKEIFICLWGGISESFLEGGVYFDAIEPNLGPATPSLLAARQIGGGTDIEITWQDNSENENGFRLAYRMTPTPPPLQWQTLAETGPDVSSYRLNDGRFNFTYRFRVAAFNDNGVSPWSNTDEVTVGVYIWQIWTFIALLPFLAAGGWYIWRRRHVRGMQEGRDVAAAQDPVGDQREEQDEKIGSYSGSV